MSPRVSLVITTYNRQDYLETAIASILQQSCPDLELVVWDDGSTDDSVNLAQQYAQRDRRVRVVAAAHQGRVAALQAAIAQTSGTYLGWVDSDDWLAPTALAETVQVLEDHPHIGMVYTDHCNINDQGQVLGIGTRSGIPYSPERLLVDFMTFHFRLLRRSVYEQVGGIDGSLDFVEDYDLCLRLSEVTQIHHLSKPLYYYRIHSGNASQQLNIEQTLRAHIIVKRALQRRGMAHTHRIDLVMPSGRFVLRRSLAHLPSFFPPSPCPARRSRGTLPQAADLFGGGSGEAAFPAPGGLGGCPPKARKPSILLPLLILSLLPWMSLLSATTAHAQSITPAADGTNTVVTPAGNRFDISGGTLSGDRANLFHSFEQFGLTQGQIANFLANPQLQNILARVVGNNPSIINGRIQITGGTPNLFLLNPAGIIFGSSASLNVPASFVATTANSVGFGTGLFTATGANDFSALTGAPDRFAFTSSQPGAIVNAGNLAVGTGQTLALLGGTVVNTGTLSAPDGKLLVAAVPGETLVRLSQPGDLLSLEFQPLTTASSAAAPTLAALLTGGNLDSATGLTVNANGSVQLTGSSLTIPTSAGTAIAAGTLNTTGQTGGAIAVVGSQVGLVGATVDGSGVNGGGTVNIGGNYQGGGTLPTATQTFISSDSTLRADATQQGNGGTVIVWGNQSTSFWGTISAQGGAISGNGGLVEVSGKENLQFRGIVDTSAANGTLGNLLLDPADIFIQAGGPGPGFSGTVLFADPGPTTIFQTDLQSLPATTNILIQATNSITFDPAIANLTFASGGFPPGSITFQAGGAISMSTTTTLTAAQRSVTFIGDTLSLGTIDTSSTFSGSGGNIQLTATGTITAADLIGNGYGFTGEPNGERGGNITVTSTDGSITVGRIQSSRAPFASTFGIASGGNVTLTTGSNGGNINFQSIDTRGLTIPAGLGPAANGGTVTISAKGVVRGAGIVPGVAGTTIATSGDGDGGIGGAVSITHDGGPTNQSFTVGSAAVNGTAGNIDTGGEAIAGQTFDFPSSPFTSAGGSIRITFANETPTISTVSSLPTTVLNQAVTFTAASLGISTFDLNADSPLFVRVVTIAPGATLRINGAIATPGTILPAGATLEFTPPLGFTGVLSNAFSITVDDVISSSPPRAISITVNTMSTMGTLNFNDPCALTTCNTYTARSFDSSLPTFELNQDSPEARFNSDFAAYLGIADPTPKTIDQQREIATQIERDTGARPAFIYISFVPESLRSGDYTSQVKGTEDVKSTEQDSDQLEIVMVTAKGDVVRRRIPAATRAKVLPLVQLLRREVSDPRKTRSTRYLQMAQQFYQWMVAPIQEPLEQRKVNNLVFLLDSGMRSLPVAVLHDGKHFLVEQYSLGTMPSLSLTDTRYRNIRDSQVLSLGISESTQGQPALPSVLVEVSTVVNDLWPGQLFLNSRATLETLKSVRKSRPYGIIHLATHADFRTGAPSNSYIQLWDEKLRLDELRGLGWNNPQIEMLVLSACSTAIGDREAELGFAGLAVQAGVKTAVASLWQVNDVATTALMTRFYRDLKTAPIKAEALRQAQLAMIRGQITVDDSGISGVEPKPIPLPPDVPGVRDRELSHPYYWSAFTIIGNPW